MLIEFVFNYFICSDVVFECVMSDSKVLRVLRELPQGLIHDFSLRGFVENFIMWSYLKLRLLSCEVIWNRGCFHLKLFETSEAVIMWSYFVIMWSGFETGNVSLTIFKGAAVSKVCYKISVMKLWTRNDDCVLNPEFLIELPDISVMLNLCYITQTLL